MWAGALVLVLVVVVVVVVVYYGDCRVEDGY